MTGAAEGADMGQKGRSGRRAAHTFYEFFAGGGMARAGLGPSWRCTFANDLDAKKAQTYSLNWGPSNVACCDVARLDTSALPGSADLAWASFPCQDLSLAGGGAGLRGARSGTFWPFWKLIQRLTQEKREPRILVLENVCGAISSHGGRDFGAISSALAHGGYRFGALVIDAIRFLPQSRPRLFFVAVRDADLVQGGMVRDTPSPEWHTKSLLKAYSVLRKPVKESWVWWHLPTPAARTLELADVLEDEPEGVRWHSRAETLRLLDMMHDIHRGKVKEASRAGRRMAGTIYKRTRMNGLGGRKIQRAEIRFDVAGCLRTPMGGSSRQTIMIIEGRSIRSRLLAPREAARLMGLPDSYRLPPNYNDAYHLVGDGVAVPVVQFLSENLLTPLRLVRSVA